MSKEVRLGLFTLLILAATIWGYTFLKGKNLLSRDHYYTTLLDDVSQLNVSSPVFINGLKVGAITKIELNPENIKQMIVHFNVDGDYRVPKNAVAEIIQESVVGGKAISVAYEELCNGSNCAENGDNLTSKNIGMLGSMLGEGEVDGYISSLSDEVKEVLENIGSEDSKGALNGTIRELEIAVKNISELSRTTNRLIASSYKSLNATLDNMSIVTNNLAMNNAKINGTLDNISGITTDLKKANIGGTLNATSENLDVSIKQLNETLKTTDEVMKNLNSVLAKANEGEGSLSKLLNDKDLYANLENTSKNLSLLLQDLRLNPKRYVNVSVFGRKGKDYVVPKDDPAFKNEEK